MIINQTNWQYPPEGYHLEGGRCPNAGRACNCIGACQPKLVRDDEPREVKYEYRHFCDMVPGGIIILERYVGTCLEKHARDERRLVTYDPWEEV